MALSVVSSVAQYLGSLVVQEKELLGGVADQILKMEKEMRWIQNFLKDADAKQDESAIVRTLVSDIREFSFDVEDAIDNYIMKAKYASPFDPMKYIRLHIIGKEINTLQSKIQDITRRVQTYASPGTVQGEGTSTPTTEIRQQSRQSYPHYYDEDVIGIEDDIDELVAELIDNESPRLVSIFGMGGLGKTTLAKKVYNHDDIKRHFDCCAWSFISQQFQARMVLQGIVKELNEGIETEKMDERELNKKLYRLLEDKCYLVVLDDIWSKEAWDVLKSAFPKGNMGSKIMITTRIKDMALYMDPLGFLHEPAFLTDEQSWELFCKKAFLSKDTASSSSSSTSSSYLPEAEKKEKLGRDVIEKCGGLPLTIVVLGGLLATKKSIHEWERVVKAQQQQREQHGVSWILSLSYHDLPFYLKPCFLYLGLYPEDTEVHKRELIQKWIAEGFVQHVGAELTKEEMGEEYLLELVNRSMIQVSTKSFRGKVKKCSLHDLMRELCLKKAKEENFLGTFDGESSSVGDSSSSSSSIRRHAIHFSCDRYASMQQSTTQGTHLRSLFLWELKSSNPVESIGMLKFVSNKFNFLRVLELQGVMVDRLPRAIGKLIHLRYFNLSAIGKIMVPSTIGNLQSMQFLALNDVERLPNVLWKMEQLTYFRCLNTYGLSCLTHDSKPLRVDGMKNLSTLVLRWEEELLLESSLPTLKNLRELRLYGIDRPRVSILYMFMTTKPLHHLQCLSLHFRSNPRYLFWSALCSFHCLWKLHLSGELERLPRPKQFPPNLTKLLLESDKLEENPIPTLETIPNLESLLLYSDGFMITKYCFSAKGFGRLQCLRLGFIYNLEEIKVEEGALPCLVHLQIKNCEKLRMLPEGLRFITTLKKLEIIDMPYRFNTRLRKYWDDWHKIQHIPSVTVR